MSDSSAKNIKILGVDISSPVVISHLPEKRLTLPQLVAVFLAAGPLKIAAAKLFRNLADRLGLLAHARVAAVELEE